VVVEVERLIGARRNMIEVPERDHAALTDMVRARAPYETIAGAVSDLKLEPTRLRLRHFAEQCSQLAGRLGKPAPTMTIEDGSVRLDTASWAGFWSGFVHAARNAMDHGIEMPEERMALGKPPAGRIAMRTSFDASNVVIEIEDDGRGIDWEAIRSRCILRGERCSSPDDLMRAVFVDGLSTTSETSEISGRGIGMGALLASTEAMGGRLRIDSEANRGTRVIMTIPMPSTTRDASSWSVVTRRATTTSHPPMGS